jgi:hypothetical protein
MKYFAWEIITVITLATLHSFNIFKKETNVMFVKQLYSLCNYVFIQPVFVTTDIFLNVSVFLRGKTSNFLYHIKSFYTAYRILHRINTVFILSLIFVTLFVLLCVLSLGLFNTLVVTYPSLTVSNSGISYASQ